MIQNDGSDFNYRKLVPGWEFWQNILFPRLGLNVDTSFVEMSKYHFVLHLPQPKQNNDMCIRLSTRNNAYLTLPIQAYDVKYRSLNAKPLSMAY